MIVIKEINGVLNVADITQTQSSTLAGTLDKPWTPIGPGTNPIMSQDGDSNVYYIAFDYLGHVYVRVMDATVWPPQIIDPTTYTPFISIQESQEAFGLGLGPESSGGHGQVRDFELYGYGRMTQTSPMYYDPGTHTLSVFFSRDYTVHPLPATLAKWRIYTRPIGGGPWTLLQDWMVDPGTLELTSTTDSLRVEVACTYGHLWTNEGRNADPDLTGDYVESAMGLPLVIDSTVEPWDYRINAASTGDFITGKTTPGDVQCAVRVQFLQEECFDFRPVLLGPNHHNGQSLLDARSQFFLVPPASSEVGSLPLGPNQRSGTALLYS